MATTSLPSRAGTAPAVAVVVTQRLASGREDEYQQWQTQVDAAAAAYAGFLGTEVVAGAGPEERSVVYRFDTTDHLRRWLGSGERQGLVARGAHLFDQPPAQQVLVDRDEDPVTVVVNHRVDPADAPAFTAWQERVVAAERAFPGFRGSDLVPPVPGVQDEWAILTTFDTTAHLEDWLSSPERQAVLADGAAFGDFTVRRIASPYGSWFGRGGGDTGPATPDWKTALSVLVGLYPTVVLLTLGLSKIWPGAPLWSSLLVGNILSVSVLTWVVMPTVTRLLRFWLEPEPPGSRRVDVVGLVLSVGFVTLAAFVFWLVTTVVWTLP